MDKTEALRDAIKDTINKSDKLANIVVGQDIFLDLLNNKNFLYYLGYAGVIKEEGKENVEGKENIDGQQEYTVLVIDSPNVTDIPNDIIKKGTFTWSEGEGTFFILNKTYKRDGKPVPERQNEATELEALFKKISTLKSSTTKVVPEKEIPVVEEKNPVVKDTPPVENTWELLSTKVQEKDFDKYYLPLLNLISEQHFNGILTGKFEANDVEVHGDQVKFVANKGNIFQYKLNGNNNLENCEEHYNYTNQKVLSKINDSCGVSLGKRRQEILDDGNIREKVKKLVYADLYNLYTIFGGTIFEDTQGILLSEGDNKYSKTTETLRTIVESFK